MMIVLMMIVKKMMTTKKNGKLYVTKTIYMRTLISMGFQTLII